jgi:hypothetical protein
MFSSKSSIEINEYEDCDYEMIDYPEIVGHFYDRKLRDCFRHILFTLYIGSHILVNKGLHGKNNSINFT